MIRFLQHLFYFAAMTWAISEALFELLASFSRYTVFALLFSLGVWTYSLSVLCRLHGPED